MSEETLGASLFEESYQQRTTDTVRLFVYSWIWCVQELDHNALAGAGAVVRLQ